MNKWGRGPISLKGVLQAIGPELISDVLNRLKRDRGSRREGSGVRANGHTGGRRRSCQTFVREGIKEKGGNPLLVIDAEVANTRED